MSDFKNNQSDEVLKSGEITGILFCIIGLMMFLTPLAVNNSNSNARRQEAKAQSLAYQAFEIRRQSSKAQRGPASEASLAGEGQLGVAPDGKPYSYRVSDEKSDWLVQVWSMTQPNHRTEVRIQKDQL